MQEFNLEEKLLRMQEIAKILEDGKRPLNELIELYEEGVRLSNECRKFLDEAEMKIETISQEFMKNQEQSIDNNNIDEDDY